MGLFLTCNLKRVYNDIAITHITHFEGFSMINNTWPVYQSVSDATRFVRALQVVGRRQFTNGQVELTFNDAYPAVTVTPAFVDVWNPVVGSWLIQSSDGSESVLSDAAFSAQFKQTSGEQVQPGDIAGAGATGIDVLKSATQEAARVAVGLAQANYSYVFGNRNAAGGDPGPVSAASGPTSNTIALRDGAGCVATGSPSSGVHATPKSYVDALKPTTAGAADTAAKLVTARALTLTGDVTGTGNFDGSAPLSIAATVGANAINNAKVAAAAGIVGTKIVTAAAVTSAGGTLTIPAGTTLDAALKIIADKVNPA